ncbi:unnamed protein product [Durusdinium trenchii]|uniref:Nucleotide-diphospho-sugar transferase domain-containing protein n=2 Tax=Durusdinium trenchii TaxID=1381693 RepID=A0ABP0KY26_9DINO
MLAKLILTQALIPIHVARCEVDFTNIFLDDPSSWVPWDPSRNAPAQLWQGNYGDAASLSCETTFDILFDWMELKRSMSLWIRASLFRKETVPQIHWERIRPIQHALTNLISLHDMTTSRDCILGMIAVRFFYLLMQPGEYRDRMLIKENSLVTDWFYMVRKFKWSVLIKSGWAPIFFGTWGLLSTDMMVRHKAKVWTDCAELPHLGRIRTFEEIQNNSDVDDAEEYWQRLLTVFDHTREDMVYSCPMAYTYVASLLALSQAFEDPIDTGLTSHFVDISQTLLRRYHEQNNFTLMNTLLSSWEFLQINAQIAMKLDEQNGNFSIRGSCGLLWCEEDLTPNPRTCKCEIVFTQNFENSTFCIFVVDNRRRSSLRNITSILSARYWTLSFGINRAYAQEHGYEIDYVQPDPALHYPGRKIGWAKVKVVHDMLRERGPERCAYGVSIDSDAFIRTSEPLSAIVTDYALNEDQQILFSEEYHSEEGSRVGKEDYINGGFFIVKNSPEGLQILQDWYNVPEKYEDMAHLKKENPQGLNYCWDVKMQPKYGHVTVLASSQLFTAPFGLVVRHNWFKDLRFEQEMKDILLQRLQKRYGCIVCQNVYDWDEFNNTDVGL